MNNKFKQPTMSSIKQDYIKFTDKHDIANAYNLHFTSIVDQYIDVIPPSSNNDNDLHDFQPLAYFVKTKLPPDNMFKIPLIIKQAFYKFLSTLYVKISAGVGGISAHILKLSVPYITHIMKFVILALQKAISQSLENGSWYTTFQERFHWWS